MTPNIDRKLQEVQNLESELREKPEIDRMINHYHGLMAAQQELADGIAETINAGYNTIKGTILGFAIRWKMPLTKHDAAKLKVELCEVNYRIHTNKQLYNRWLTNAHNWEKHNDAVTKDCNNNFEQLLAKAQAVKGNPKIAHTLVTYHNEKNNQELKNNFYLRLKFLLLVHEKTGHKKN